VKLTTHVYLGRVEYGVTLPPLKSFLGVGLNYNYSYRLYTYILYFYKGQIVFWGHAAGGAVG
jgi:hypothetical protein